MPSPLEKGDRGAVDKDYPGIKENDTKEKSVFPKCHWRKTLLSFDSTDISYRNNHLVSLEMTVAVSDTFDEPEQPK